MALTDDVNFLACKSTIIAAYLKKVFFQTKKFICFPDPDFRKQSKMMQVIQSAGIQHVDCAALFSPMSGGYYTECKRVTSLMMTQQFYDEARKFAAVSETPADHITLEQVRL